MAEREGKPFQYILPALQHYAWGVKGDKSVAARVYSRAHHVSIDPEKEYAELWYACHPNGESEVILEDSQRVKLSDFIRHNPEYQQIPPDPLMPLPFILKLLCSRVPLSIQCHPNRQSAARLARERPDMFKDPNHKPEIGVALSDDVQILIGFRVLREIAFFVNQLHPLKAILGEGWASNAMSITMQANNESAELDIYRDLFSAFLDTKGEQLHLDCLRQIREMSEHRDEGTLDASVIEALNVFSVLYDQYPGDPGCFSPFFMNIMTLQPGQAVFIPANLLHFYFKGQIIECMACSDNVVRAGLTPKARDIPLLKELLEYGSRTAKSLQLDPVEVPVSSEGGYLKPRLFLYDPSIGDFRVYLIYIPKGSAITTPVNLKGESAAIFTVLKGKAEMRLKLLDNTYVATGMLEQGNSLLLPVASRFTLHSCHSHPSAPPSTSTLDDTDVMELGAVQPPLLVKEHLLKLMRFKEEILEDPWDTDFLAMAAVGGPSILPI